MNLGVLEPIRTKRAPAPRGCYSQAVRSGRLVLTSGIGPRDATTGQLVPATIEEQTNQTLRNLAAVLAAAGAMLSDVAHVTVYLGDLARDYRGFDETYRAWWSDTPPARTTIGAVLPGILIEMEVTAIIASGERSAD